VWRAIRGELLEADEAEQVEWQELDEAEPPSKKLKYLLVLILAIGRAADLASICNLSSF